MILPQKFCAQIQTSNYARVQKSLHEADLDGLILSKVTTKILFLRFLLEQAYSFFLVAE